MTPSDWAPSDLVSQQRSACRVPLSYNQNFKPIPSSSGISDMNFEGGERSARDLDKLEIIKL